MDDIRPVRGMKDMYFEDAAIYKNIINIAEQISENYGFTFFSTPIVEHTNVFTRTLGDTSDIVSKEMYTFNDKGGNSLTLRPEFTAGIIRALISNKLQNYPPLRLFSYGPVFRYDRPQAGRYRQFHQINFECVGISGPYIDAEMINMGYDIIKSLGIKNVTLHINSLGCEESRKSHKQALIEYFEKYQEDLSDLSKIRLYKNPLRIFDSKNEMDQTLCQDAPLINEYYTKESQVFFENVLKFLDIFDIDYKINHKLVRGLDYYCLTAFEFVDDSSNTQQSTILAGGRYDKLSEMMGGKNVPAIGFAAGVERLAIALNNSVINYRNKNIHIVTIGDEVMEYAVKLSNILRSNNIACIISHEGKLHKRLKDANQNKVKYVIIIGSNEVLNSQYILKNMEKSIETVCNIEDIIHQFTE